MKGRLLPATVFDELLAAQDVPAIIEILLRSDYAEDLSISLSRKSGVEAVEDALSNNLARNFHKLVRIVVGELRRPVVCFVERWDVHNVKTVLRGIHSRALPDEMRRALIPAGELDPAALEQLLQQSDMSGFLNLLSTWNLPYARPIARHIAQYQASGNLWLLEHAIDRDYYERAFRSLGGGDGELILVRKIFALEIDVTNAMLSLRFAGAPEVREVASMLLSHGTVELSVFETASQARNFADALAAFAGTWLEAPQTAEVRRPSDLERRLEEVFVRRASSLCSKDPGSIAPLLGYVWRKYKEFLNLRVVVRSKAFGLPEDQMRKELLLG